MEKIKYVILIFLSLYLSGCSLLSPVKTDNYTTYVINSSPTIVSKSKNNITLYVSPMTSHPLYNTAEMAYTERAFQVEYFAKNRWADEPAKMIQPLIVQTLQNTQHFHAVTSTTTAVRVNYMLNLKLIELRQMFLRQSNYVVVKIYAEIVNKNGVIIASKEFEATALIHRRDAFGGVVAANKAVCEVIREIVEFCLHTI